MQSLLIVEDDEELLGILQRWFTRRGMAVVACGDTKAALAATAQQAFDVAVVDGILRGGDGVSLVRQLQTLNQNMRVIMLSGRANPEAIALALKAGVCEYLCKPCGLAELEAAVERAAVQVRNPIETST